MARAASRSVSPGRSFDPLLVGALECETWVSYYRREWWKFLRVAVRATRHAFALPWPTTLLAAWWVMRANQRWAPYPDNDPAAARRCMRRFYAVVARHHGEPFDVTEAARLELEWWRLHREGQHAEGPQRDLDDEAPLPSEQPLVAAIARLYSHLYATPVETVLFAAAQRTVAMRLSDHWVEQGAHVDSPLIARERAALVRSYAALLAAVHRPT